MITCRELVELLSDFLDGELAPEQRLVVEQHLGQCPGCVVYVETYQLTIQMTRRLPGTPLPAELEVRLRIMIERIQRGQSEEDV